MPPAKKNAPGVKQKSGRERRANLFKAIEDKRNGRLLIAYITSTLERGFGARCIVDA
jgi:hypothetical protein